MITVGMEAIRSSSLQSQRKGSCLRTLYCGLGSIAFQKEAPRAKGSIKRQDVQFRPVLNRSSKEGLKIKGQCQESGCIIVVWIPSLCRRRLHSSREEPAVLVYSCGPGRATMYAKIPNLKHTVMVSVRVQHYGFGRSWCSHLSSKGPASADTKMQRYDRQFGPTVDNLKDILTF